MMVKCFCFLHFRDTSPLTTLPIYPGTKRLRTKRQRTKHLQTKRLRDKRSTGTKRLRDKMSNGTKRLKGQNI